MVTDSQVRTRLNTADFIKRAKSVHGDKYDYSRVEYVNASVKVGIVCPVHGEFTQTPNNHISKAAGCKHCADDMLRSSGSEFISKAVAVWGDRFDYSEVDYRGSLRHVEITCRGHDYTFHQSPNSHLSGRIGCHHCSSNNRGAGIVYLVEIETDDGEKFVKIGWTATNVKQRFVGCSFTWTLLDFAPFPTANDGEKFERHMHKLLQDCKYEPTHSFEGETECFEIKDKKLIQTTFQNEAEKWQPV